MQNHRQGALPRPGANIDGPIAHRPTRFVRLRASISNISNGLGMSHLLLFAIAWGLITASDFAHAHARSAPDAEANPAGESGANPAGGQSDPATKHVVLLHSFSYEQAAHMIMDLIFPAFLVSIFDWQQLERWGLDEVRTILADIRKDDQRAGKWRGVRGVGIAELILHGRAIGAWNLTVRYNTLR
jgi:hypothetical protein